MNAASPFSLPYSLSGRRVWVAGHRGMLGQALLRRLAAEPCEVLTADRQALDLRRQQPTEEWVAENRPELIFLPAARVGGIQANMARPGEFLYDNLMIQANVLEAARRAGGAKVVLVGSAAVYPRSCPQPMAEDQLLAGPLEPTNQWYALAKIAGLKLGQAYRRQYGLDVVTAVPTNLYGPHDHFDLESGHVAPALLRRVHEAHQQGQPEVVIWGTGNARREFLHVDDCAAALVHLAEQYSGEEHVNVGVGEDVSIRELAELIAEVVGYRGRLIFDTSRPDGAPRKLLDIGHLRQLGWSPRIELRAGLRATYAWYRGQNAGAGQAADQAPAYNRTCEARTC